jgi:putative nucleotidyltransferase with HDIG domain
LSEDPKHIEICRGIVKFLDATVKNMTVYPPEHPSVKGVSKRVHDLLTEILEGRDEILVGIVNGILYVDDYHFNEATPYSENFLKILSAFEIDDLLIASGVTEEDVLKLAGILKNPDHSKEVFFRLAEEGNLKHIGLKGFLTQEEEDDPTEGIVNAYWEAVITVAGFFREVTEGRLPPLDGALDLVEGFRKNLATDRATLLLLTSLKGYERYTEQHCVNVCLLAMLLAEKEGLDEQEIGWAALAGLMHDAGMVKVPREVADKSGSLTLGERETFKSHPVHSAGIVHGMGGPDEVVLSVERHHVHYGGGGYPVGYEKEQIPLLAGIVSVVDSYDAITTVRPYNRPMDPVQALTFLEKGRGTRFDPRHVDAFKSMVGPWPPGSVVRLSSNEIGVVTRPGERPDQPVVKMVVDENGTTLEDPWDLDLAEDEVQGRLIAGVVDPALYNLSAGVVFS